LPSHSRPLSPHLSIYKFTLTMATSIIHRGTGMAMYAGTLLIVLWFGAAALGEAPLGVVHWVLGSWFGQIVLFLATWALFQHLFGGLRHFIWDSGNAFDPEGREWLARLNLICSIVLTLVVWAAFVWF